MKCQIGYRYRGYSRSGHPKEPVSGMCDPRVPSVSISDLTFHSIPPLYYANNIYFLDSVKVMCSKRIGVPVSACSLVLLSLLFLVAFVWFVCRTVSAFHCYIQIILIRNAR